MSVRSRPLLSLILGSIISDVLKLIVTLMDHHPGRSLPYYFLTTSHQAPNVRSERVRNVPDPSALPRPKRERLLLRRLSSPLPVRLPSPALTGPPVGGGNPSLEPLYESTQTSVPPLPSGCLESLGADVPSHPSSGTYDDPGAPIRHLKTQGRVYV